ncbi:hypothetical protein [Candidatus Leptofilum sp.]|uniref:hypothetical protein n=1 Tax=Candidatus Leptofilum sp. TaxID=3241576 RepID=UPI003B59DFA7
MKTQEKSPTCFAVGLFFVNMKKSSASTFIEPLLYDGYNLLGIAQPPTKSNHHPLGVSNPMIPR